MRESIKSFSTAVAKIESIIGYSFRDKSLLRQAFTRTSWCNEANQRGMSYQSNEVLEFVGDSVLSVSIITFLMKENAQRYENGIKTKLGEGDFSNIKSKLSDKTNLSRCIKALGLEKHLLLGEGDRKLGIESEPSVMEDLFESIIGAVYIDSDMSVPTVMKVVSKMLDISLYAIKEAPIQSSKNALQEFCADKKRRLPPPIYKTMSEEGPDHKKTYERGVYIGERLVATAKGKNQKIADSAAAELALKILKDEEAATAKKQEPSATAKKQEPSVKAKEAAKSTESTAKPTVKADAGRKKTVTTTKAQTTVDKGAAPKASTAKVENEPKKPQNATRGQASSSSKLKTHATKSKVATPTFKDLGESKVNGKTVYRVECIFMGKSAIGTGATRPEAKENAASEILSTIALAPTKKLHTKTPSKKGKK